MRDLIMDAMVSQTLDEDDPGLLEAGYLLRPSLEVFLGHFPGFPLVPGVMLIEMVRCTVDVNTEWGHRILRVRKAKFSGMVRPGQTVSLKGRLTTKGGVLSARATLKVDGKEVAKISIELEREVLDEGGTEEQQGPDFGDQQHWLGAR